MNDFKNTGINKNLDSFQDSSLEKEIDEFEKNFLGKKEIKKIKNNIKWFKFAKIFWSIMLAFILISFLCLFIMFVYHTFYFLTTPNFKVWENNFYSLLKPLPIINAVLIIINLSFSGFFVFFCEKYDDNGKDLHLDAVSAKVSFFSKCNLILWVFIICFYAAALAGLTLFFSNYTVWIWVVAIFIIFFLTIAIMIFSIFISSFIFKNMNFYIKN